MRRRGVCWEPELVGALTAYVGFLLGIANGYLLPAWGRASVFLFGLPLGGGP